MIETTASETKTSKLPNQLVRLVVLALVSGVVGGVGGSYLLQRYTPGDSLRPPIAILDISTVAHDIPKQGDVSILVNERVEKLRAAADKLRKAGWIVLDSQAVVGAPEALYVPYDTNR